MILNMQKYIHSESLFNTLHIEMKHKKIHSALFRELQPITVFL